MSSVKDIKDKQNWHLCLHICLSGLGTPEFDRAIQNISLLQVLFECKFPENDLERWSKSVMVEGYTSVDLVNCLFTPAYLSPSLLEKHITPSSDIDPSGIISAISEEGELLYLEDNNMLYFKKHVIEAMGEEE